MHTGSSAGRTTGMACGNCDGFACAIEAKNDLATAVIRPVLAQGLDLRTGIAVSRIETDGHRVDRVVGVDTASGETLQFSAPVVILAAGALATPHLLLASGLESLNPASVAVGRYLTRHRNEILLGIFARRPDPDHTFHKQLGIHDFYFGDPADPKRLSRAGGLQQLPTPPIALARDGLPRPLRPLARFVDNLTGLLLIAEDQPRHSNGVKLGSGRDALGMPTLEVTHRYSDRDLEAAALLRRNARRILRRAGAVWVYRHIIDTYSHGLGTVRIGVDPATSPLDAEHRFRGLENLYVTDGSALPRAAGVNPSLTIAAMSLRASARIIAASQPAAARMNSR